MRQRVAIAIAMLNKPDLIIADEPTTALDVTTQAQIIDEMQQLCAESGTALIWITHDLAVISEIADRVAVMYAGSIVEMGEAAQHSRSAGASLHAGPARLGAEPQSPGRAGCRRFPARCSRPLRRPAAASRRAAPRRSETCDAVPPLSLAQRWAQPALLPSACRACEHAEAAS